MAKIAKYNEVMLATANQIANKNPANSKLTSLEKGRAALEFIKMNE